MFLYTYLKTYVLFFVVIIQYEDLITLPSCLNRFIKIFSSSDSYCVISGRSFLQVL